MKRSIRVRVFGSLYHECATRLPFSSSGCRAQTQWAKPAQCQPSLFPIVLRPPQGASGGIERPGEAPDGRERHSKALSGDGLSEWSHVEPESPKPLRHHSKLRAALARDRQRARSKSAEKARARSVEKPLRAKVEVKNNRKKAASPGPTTTRSAPAPATPSTSSKHKRTKAEELEEMLKPHMDPYSIATPGSRATKAYWVQRVADLEEEWHYCNLPPEPMEEEEPDKLSPDGVIDLEQDEDDFSIDALRAARKAAAEDEKATRLVRTTRPTPSKARSQAGSEDGQGEGPSEDPYVDRPHGPVPLRPEQSFLGRPGGEHHVQPPEPALHVQVEDVCVDAADQGGDQGRDGAAHPLEEKSQVDDASARATAGSDVGPLGSSPPDVQRSPSSRTDDRRKGGPRHPSRGLEQKLKRGAMIGSRNLGLLTLVATWQASAVIAEVFPTGGLGHQNDESQNWKVEGPWWDQPGPPSMKKCGQLWRQLQECKPDVLIMQPPFVDPGLRGGRDRSKNRRLRRFAIGLCGGSSARCGTTRPSTVVWCCC